MRWLPWAEYCYNTSFQASLRTSPFKVVYGHEPPSLRTYEPGDARLAAVEAAAGSHRTYRSILEHEGTMCRRCSSGELVIRARRKVRVGRGEDDSEQRALGEGEDVIGERRRGQGQGLRQREGKVGRGVGNCDGVVEG